MCSSNYWENQESRILLTALVLARVDGGECGVGRQRQTLGKSVRSQSLSKLFPTLPFKLNFWTIFYLTQSNKNIISPYIMGWIVFPQIHVETLTSELIMFGDRVFTEVIKVKWGHQSGPNRQGGWSRTPDCCPYEKEGFAHPTEMSGVYVHREKTVCRVGREQPSVNQGEKPQRKQTLLALWSSTSSLQNYRKIKLCCLSPLVCDTFLWQP